MTTWQKIDTAPKDGTHILASWVVRNERRIGVFRWIPSGEWSSVPGGWCYEATHWMPLPDPPDAD